MKLTKSMDFLIRLKVNNERNWFKENEELYREALEEFMEFVEGLIPQLRALDSSVDVSGAKECMFRIFRDVRFSSHKEPYKTNFGAFIARGGRKSPFGGYYVHFEPDASFLGGGVYMPESKYLLAIRKAIYRDPAAYKDIILGKDFRSTFGEVYGEKLKTAPKGFDRDFPDIDLIRNKHYAVTHPVENEFWLSGMAQEKAMSIFKTLYPLNKYLNRIIEKT